MERQKLSKTFRKSFRKTVYFFYLLVVFTNPLVYLELPHEGAAQGD